MPDHICFLSGKYIFIYLVSNGWSYLFAVFFSGMGSRKNAMLTTEDRRWLTGEKVYEGEHAKQQRYQRRRDIRERVYNTMLDFSILFTHLEERERAKLFGGSTEERRERFSDTDLENGVRDGLAFLLYNAGVTDLMDAEGTDDALVDRLLNEAVSRAGRKDDVLVERVSLDIEATQLSSTDALRRLEAGEELSPTELGYLIESETIDTTEIQEQIRSVLFGGDDPADEEPSG